MIEARRRAHAVVTLLLNDDLRQANELIKSDEDPARLTMALAQMSTGLLQGYAEVLGRDPLEMWQRSLLSQATKE